MRKRPRKREKRSGRLRTLPLWSALTAIAARKAQASQPPIPSAHVRNCLIGVTLGAMFYLLENFSLQCLSLHVRHNFRTHLSKGTVKNALHDGLSLCTAACFVSNFLVVVHVLFVAANES